MEWELAGFTYRAAENQERNQSCARAEGCQPAFEAAISVVVEKERAGAVVKPEHPQEQPEIADARGDKCFFRRCRRAGPVNPESDKQIRSNAYQFPTNEKQKQTV